MLQLAEHLDAKLRQPAHNLFGPQSPIMAQSQELRALLGERNPFVLGVSPHDSSAWLADIAEDLHNDNGRFFAFKDLIFPNGLIYRPDDGCRIPFCKRLECPGEREGWELLQTHLLEYRAEENLSVSMLKYCIANATAAFKSENMRVLENGKTFFFKSYLNSNFGLLNLTIFLALFSTLPSDDDPRGAESFVSPVLRYLNNAGWTISRLIHLLSKYAVRVYGLYTKPGGRSRAVWTIGQSLPMTWYIPAHEYTVSLSADLPTKFSKRYLSVRPDDVPVIGERFMREGHRMRVNGRN